MVFSQSVYRAYEDAGPSQSELVLSSQSTVNITVEVVNADGSATGEYCSTCEVL